MSWFSQARPRFYRLSQLVGKHGNKSPVLLSPHSRGLDPPEQQQEAVGELGWALLLLPDSEIRQSRGSVLDFLENNRSPYLATIAIISMETVRNSISRNKLIFLLDWSLTKSGDRRRQKMMRVFKKNKISVNVLNAIFKHIFFSAKKPSKKK